VSVVDVFAFTFFIYMFDIYLSNIEPLAFAFLTRVLFIYKTKTRIVKI
jgi:hypothetical protein